MTLSDISQRKKDEALVSPTEGRNTESDKRAHRQQCGGHEGAGVGERTKRVWGFRYVATEGGWTWGGEHTTQYIDHIL